LTGRRIVLSAEGEDYPESPARKKKPSEPKKPKKKKTNKADHTIKRVKT